MQSEKKKWILTGFLAATLLTACAGAVGIDAGCRAYTEARLTLPFDDLSDAPKPVVDWINLMDARMFAVCKG